MEEQNTEGKSGVVCGVRKDRYVCTRRPGHGGEHVATTTVPVPGPASVALRIWGDPLRPSEAEVAAGHPGGRWPDFDQVRQPASAADAGREGDPPATAIGMLAESDNWGEVLAQQMYEAADGRAPWSVVEEDVRQAWRREAREAIEGVSWHYGAIRMGRRWFATRFHPSRDDLKFWESGEWKLYSIAELQRRQAAEPPLPDESKEPGEERAIPGGRIEGCRFRWADGGLAIGVMDRGHLAIEDCHFHELFIGRTPEGELTLGPMDTQVPLSAPAAAPGEVHEFDRVGLLERLKRRVERRRLRNRLIGLCCELEERERDEPIGADDEWAAGRVHGLRQAGALLARVIEELR